MDKLIQAAEDLRYLLGRGYPRTGALTFAGNHYQLPREQREILNRGVYPDAEASARRCKLLPPDSIAGRSVGVDGHNVLITLESALRDRTIVECDDGLIRDVAGVYASYQPDEWTDKALRLVLDYLVEHRVHSIVFLLDAPLSFSGELAAEIGAVMSGKQIMGRARAVPVPDAELYAFSGLVATSDSVLIDRVDEPLDLAGCIIRERFPGLERRSLRPTGSPDAL